MAAINCLTTACVLVVGIYVCSLIYIGQIWTKSRSHIGELKQSIYIKAYYQNEMAEEYMGVISCPKPRMGSTRKLEYVLHN